MIIQLIFTIFLFIIGTFLLIKFFKVIRKSDVNIINKLLLGLFVIASYVGSIRILTIIIAEYLRIKTLLG